MVVMALATPVAAALGVPDDIALAAGLQRILDPAGHAIGVALPIILAVVVAVRGLRDADPGHQPDGMSPASGPPARIAPVHSKRYQTTRQGGPRP